MVKSLKAGIALAIVAIFATVGLVAAPVHADSVSAFEISGTYSYAAGSITWIDYRSVKIKGEVCYWAGSGNAQVRFDFWLANRVPFGRPETRTTSDWCEPFNFSVAGPKGGIQEVGLRLCESIGACVFTPDYRRP